MVMIVMDMVRLTCMIIIVALCIHDLHCYDCLSGFMWLDLPTMAPAADC